MHLHDHSPLDVLSRSLSKAAFLADACTALAEAKGRYDLSPRGLEGLAEYLHDLESSLAYVDQSHNRKEV